MFRSKMLTDLSDEKPFSLWITDLDGVDYPVVLCENQVDAENFFETTYEKEVSAHIVNYKTQEIVWKSA